jgi:hypothetical protein
MADVDVLDALPDAARALVGSSRRRALSGSILALCGKYLVCMEAQQGSRCGQKSICDIESDARMAEPSAGTVYARAYRARKERFTGRAGTVAIGALCLTLQGYEGVKIWSSSH